MTLNKDMQRKCPNIEKEPRKRYQNKRKRREVGIAVASETRGPRFKPNYKQKFKINILNVVC